MTLLSPGTNASPVIITFTPSMVSSNATGSVSQVATIRLLIQRYQDGLINIKGKKGPSMKMLPKKLPQNRVSIKYIPLHDTMILWPAEDYARRSGDRVGELQNLWGSQPGCRTRR